MKRKTRKDKEKIYKEKYSDIPKDYNERLEYIIDKYNVNYSYHYTLNVYTIVNIKKLSDY